MYYYFKKKCPGQSVGYNIAAIYIAYTILYNVEYTMYSMQL